MMAAGETCLVAWQFSSACCADPPSGFALWKSRFRAYPAIASSSATICARPSRKERGIHRSQDA